MRATLHGAVTRPAVVVVGVWDPFMPFHRTLLTRLHDTAASSERTSLAVLIDPQPGSRSTVAHQFAVGGWPVYDSVPVRTRLIRDAGVDAVLCLRFRAADFKATAAQFLDALKSYAEIDELWLGELQMLGPGTAGSHGAIIEYTRTHGITVTVLARAPIAVYDVRYLLARGRIQQAVEQVTRPPTWNAPRAGALRLAWSPGRYRAVEFVRPGSLQDGRTFELELTAQRRRPATLLWPAGAVRYLGFVHGPADGRAT
jgi:FAD synthase